MNPIKRIQREAESLRKKPCREFLAYPCESNPFVWMFTMRGPAESPYEKGVYHGKLLLPSNYPMAPPDVMLTTPNGRFALNTKICLSEVTSYHPENWQPSWGVHTVLHALRGFMVTPGNSAVGAIEYSVDERERLALESRSWESPEGAKMVDHIALLDASPPWAERESTTGAAPSTPAPAPAADTDTPATPAAAVESPARTEDASPTPTPADAATPPPAQDPAAAAAATPVPPPAAEAAAPAPAAAPPATPAQANDIPPTAWQISEATLDNIVIVLLMGIFAILSKKHFANELFA